MSALDEPTIDQVTACAYTVPTSSPEADGTLAWDSTTIVTVLVRAGDTVGTGWTYGPPACATAVRNLLTDVVVGRQALDVGGAYEAMSRQLRNAGRQGIAGYALSAVDVALWDLMARLLGVPLHRLLGAERDRVPIYGSGGFTTYDDARLDEQLQGWLGLGARAVKIKIAEEWGTREERDLARIRQVRETVGPAVALMVDANGGYSVKQAVRVAQEAAELGVSWLEEPVSSDDLEGLRIVRSQVVAEVTAGEYGCEPYYFRRMCESGAVDCLQADATRCGGVTGWLRAATVAAAYGLDLSGHCAPHLHAPVAAAIPNLRHLEWFHDHVRIADLAFDGAARPHQGMLSLDRSAPGHGITVRQPDLAPYEVHS